MMRGYCLALAVAVFGAAAGISTGCGGDDNENTGGSNPCPGGICGSGANDSSSNGSGANGSGGEAGCIPAWVCSPWDTMGNGDGATRTCVDTNNCGTETNRPTEAANLPALDENYYRCNVEPIMDRLCSQLGCHGREPDLANGDPGRGLRIYHRGRLRITGEIIQGEPGCLNQPDQNSEDCIGSVECACWTRPHTPTEWQRNYDAARGFALDAGGAPLMDATTSELLAQPLKGGGLPHAGIKVWNPSDANYQTIQAWLEGATLGNCGTTN